MKHWTLPPGYCLVPANLTCTWDKNIAAFREPVGRDWRDQSTKQSLYEVHWEVIWKTQLIGRSWPFCCTVKCIWKHLPCGFLFPRASPGRWSLAGNLGCFLAQTHRNSSGSCLKPVSAGDSGTCFNCLVRVLWHLKSISDRLVFRRRIWQTDILLLAPALPDLSVD